MTKKIKAIGAYRPNPILKTLAATLDVLADQILKRNKEVINSAQKAPTTNPKAQQVKKQAGTVPVKRVTKSQPSQPKKATLHGKRVYNRVELQDATAEAIIFLDVEDVTKVSKRDKAEINGEPAKGDYVMPDGKIFRFVDGRLSKIIPATEEALAQMKAYLDSKKLKPNPTATPENRFAGILDRYKEDRRRKQIEDYKRKNKK